MDPQMTFQRVCAVAGLICPLLFFGAFIAAGFIPPLAPSASAAQIAAHYQSHATGIRLGAGLMLPPHLDMLPPAPTDERLSQTVDHFSGSGHRLETRGARREMRQRDLGLRVGDRWRRKVSRFYRTETPPPRARHTTLKPDTRP
jgi:hypothetical protein